MKYALALVAVTALCAPLSAEVAASSPATAATRHVPASPPPVMLERRGQRTTELYVFAAVGKPRGVILASHGGGSSPARMMPLIAPLQKAGFTVLAPLHGDSTSLPAERRQDLRTALGSRVGDFQAAAGYAAARWAGLPLGALGYSYGSLTALIGGGALDYTGMPRVAALRAIATFSSPGIIPGLVMPANAYAKIAAPTLMVTGDADRVPGFVADPADHLLPFTGSPAGGRTALVIKGATHALAAGTEPGFALARDAMVDFFAANLLGDPKAGARLAGLKSDAAAEIRRR